jgi:hypothetical protein
MAVVSNSFLSFNFSKALMVAVTSLPENSLQSDAQYLTTSRPGKGKKKKLGQLPDASKTGVRGALSKRFGEKSVLPLISSQRGGLEWLYCETDSRFSSD